MDTDPRWNTGSHYDGHKVRAGKQADRRTRKIRHARRGFRRFLANMSFELGDEKLLENYMAPVRRGYDRDE